MILKRLETCFSAFHLESDFTGYFTVADLVGSNIMENS